MLSAKLIKYSHTASQLQPRVKLGQRMERVVYGKFSMFWANASSSYFIQTTKPTS